MNQLQTDAEKAAQYLHLWTKTDIELAQMKKTFLRMRDENEVLKRENECLIAYIAGEGRQDHRQWVKTECERRYRGAKEEKK